ncbi:uncharacterized protein B0H64DRAFT_233596 [Chaetomium fimeti]|uniref:Uncharacterized protein n=1 Tax=Chaetomium fimeti TaxID=1854472 RepID=A0AAE0H9V5_9PEZI|nr:hypothetical protein B0H64DRAFT_233596 [Chaetomium fimeti]
MAVPEISPAMAYQPIGSPSLGYGNDDGDNERKWMTTFSLTTTFRILVALFAFADIVASISLRLTSGSGLFVVVFIALFLVLGWNLALLQPRSRFIRALPAVSCRVGDYICGFNGDDDHDERLEKPRSKKQKRAKLILVAFVDLVLGLIVTIAWCMPEGIGWRLVSYWWYGGVRDSECLLPLIMTLGALQFALAVISLVACFWSLDFKLGVVLRYIDDPDRHHRIQLAPDTEDRRTAGGTVSVAA